MRFFRRKSGEEYTIMPATAPPRPAVPGAIAYDPGLIEILHADHAQLDNLYERIGRLAESGNHDALRDALDEFKSAFQAHILTENVHFYAYLERAAALDAASARRIHDFRRRMNATAQHIARFADTWLAGSLDAPAARAAFDTDYRKAGEHLVQRLDSEESNLFPLYKPD